MQIKLRGRVIDSYKGTNEKYPNTRFTLTDVNLKGQINLEVPPAQAGLLEHDGLYDIDCEVQAFNSRVTGQRLTYVSGRIDRVDGAPVKSK
jgi:hypothetical protein